MEDSDVANREVTWKVFEDAQVNGTITAPAGRGTPRPVVILLAGSGPTDRNWCSPVLAGDNGSGKLLAEALARRGFLTLRYDKLGSRPNVKENLPKFAGRVSAWRASVRSWRKPSRRSSLRRIPTATASSL